jgi:hypothetical protein
MKNIIYITTVFVLLNVSLKAQSNDTPLSSNSKSTYLLFRIGITVGGTPTLLKSSMTDHGYDERTAFIFPTKYPKVSWIPSLEMELGKHLNKTKSISVLFGLRESGTVHGYNGYGDIDIHFTNWVINPRLKFHTHAISYSGGPSIVLINYDEQKEGSTYENSKILPGLSLTIETVNQMKTGGSLGLFATLNLHPGFQIEPLTVYNPNEEIFESKINPSSLQIGVRYQLF